MSPLRLNGSTSGYSQLDAPAIAGDQTFTLPGTGGTIDRLNRAGNILQVVNATYSTQASSTSATYADTGLTATITPTSASSKILVLVTQEGVGKAAVDAAVGIRLLRGSTTLIDVTNEAAYTGNSTGNIIGASTCSYLDSPATASSVTYKTQFASKYNSATVYVQKVSSTSTITLMEVAA